MLSKGRLDLPDQAAQEDQRVYRAPLVHLVRAVRRVRVGYGAAQDQLDLKGRPLTLVSCA